MEECNLCQRMKNKTEEMAGKLKLSEVLRSMSPGDSMDMGKGYDDDDQLRRSNLSQRLI